jgi:hypothetical protein
VAIVLSVYYWRKKMKFAPTETVIRGNNEHKKIDIYKWSKPDAKGVFTEIDKRELNVDHDYQRENIAWGKVRQLASKWSWTGCGCILVAKRFDDSYWVFDGQHRVLAAMQRSDINTLPCLVFDLQQKTDEAKGFLFANQERKPVVAIDKFRASVMTGDEVAVKIKEVLDNHSVSIDHQATKAKQIKCVALCKRLAQRNLDAFEWALVSAIHLCGNRGIHNDILQGLFWIENKHGLCGDERFEKALKSACVEECLDSISRYAAAEGKRGEAVCGKGILKVLNYKRRNKFGDETGIDE